jgi:hypothetical protein
MAMATVSKPGGKLAVGSTSLGISATQVVQVVAQKFTSTTLPLRAPRRALWPSSVVARPAPPAGCKR